MKKYILAFALFFHFCFIAAASDRDSERPEKKESIPVLDYSFFPDSLIDSLVRVFQIEDQRGLRTITNHHFPKFKNEHFLYDAGWEFIRAGYLDFNANLDSKGQILKVDARAYTNSVASAFYNLKDNVLSTIDYNGIYPLFFEQHIKENRYRNDTWIITDHKKGMIYSNAREDTTKYKVTPFIHDFISLFYSLRMRDIKLKDTFSIRCFAHEKDYPILFTVLGKEKLTVPAGTFDCIKLNVRLVGQGRGFTSKDKMFLWLSDDSRKIMIQGMSKLKLGSITLKLLSHSRE